VTENRPAPAAKALGGAIAEARANYVKSRDSALKNYAPGRPRLEAEFERAMKDLEARFTRAGQLEHAKRVRDAKADAEFASGTNLLPTMKGNAEVREGHVVMPPKQSLATERTFAPPIEITYVLKTDDQIRIGYGADQIILNWELNRDELRIDGGPVSGQHVRGGGAIPKNTWITVKQIVLAQEMVLMVDGERRAKWAGNFSRINAPIRINATGATIGIKQVTARKLDIGQ
jgi:hypothetical protein